MANILQFKEGRLSPPGVSGAQLRLTMLMWVICDDCDGEVAFWWGGNRDEAYYGQVRSCLISIYLVNCSGHDKVTRTTDICEMVVM